MHADHAHRLLEHQRQLRGLDRRDHAAGRSCGPSRRSSRTPPPSSRPRRSSRSAACRPRASSPAPARRCARGAASPPRAASRRARPPACAPTRAHASRAAAIAASTCSGEAAPTLGERLLGGRVLDGEPRALARHLLPGDQQPGLHGATDYRARRGQRTEVALPPTFTVRTAFGAANVRSADTERPPPPRAAALMRRVFLGLFPRWPRER